MNEKLLCLFLVCIFLLLFFSGCMHTPPSVLYVDDSFDEQVNGWQFDHFNSIQQAIEKGGNNCTIYVNSGVYTESIVINKSVVLIGENATKTIIKARHDQNGIVVGSQGRIYLSHFTVRSAGNPDLNAHTPAGLILYSDDNQVVHNMFINNSCGLYCVDATSNIISENMFQKNFYGLALANRCSDQKLYNNSFFENQIGLRIKSSTNNTVFENVFADNVGGAYVCCGSRNNLFYLNIFYDNAQFQAQDWELNIWNTSTVGNYWGDYHLPSQGAFDQNNDGIVDSPYNISRGYQPEEYPNKDYRPLVYKPFSE